MNKLFINKKYTYFLVSTLFFSFGFTETLKEDSIKELQKELKGIDNFVQCAPGPNGPQACNGEKIPSRKPASVRLNPGPIGLPANKFNLNRYYFLRHCDTPESLAKMLYGKTERASDLLRWNAGKKWQAGQAIYFYSPVNPGDSKLQALYEEHPGRTEVYTVQKGDNLQKIAQKHLGDYRSWRDIAFLNNIKSPSDIRIGQNLNLKFLR